MLSRKEKISRNTIVKQCHLLCLILIFPVQNAFADIIEVKYSPEKIAEIAQLSASKKTTDESRLIQNEKDLSLKIKAIEDNVSSGDIDIDIDVEILKMQLSLTRTALRKIGQRNKIGRRMGSITSVSANTSSAAKAYYDDVLLKIEEKIEGAQVIDNPLQKYKGRFSLIIDSYGECREIKTVGSTGDFAIDKKLELLVLQACPFKPFSRELYADYDLLNIIKTYSIE